MGQKRNLILVRHGQSEWNKKNLFTGWKNPGLTPLGYEEADNAGVAIKKTEIVFDVMFTSDLKRAQITGTNILKQINQEDLVTIKNQALNERDYGSLSGEDLMTHLRLMAKA
jgi:2,3-bisphosphoglycerate-dependent phosphoglycerate mutase